MDAPAGHHFTTDEKTSNSIGQDDSYRRYSSSGRRSRTIRHFMSAALFTAAVLLFLRKVYVSDRSELHNAPTEIHSGLVKLEAHIMSKCPDARDCLRQLIVPAMEQVGDKVAFRLSYIGRIVNNETDEVECKHGPPECLGNMIQLCAERIYPDPKLYLGFATCMTSSYSQIPDRELVEHCAMEHGIDLDRVKRCLSDEGHGTELLRSSVQRSIDHNVTKSCTVRLAGEIRCIRDGGRWYDCPGGSNVDDLVRDINQLYSPNVA